MNQSGIPSRRTFLTLAAGLTATATLGACSRSAGKTSGGGATGSGSLNVLFPQTHAGASEILKADFEKAKGVTVNVTLVPYDELQQKATLDVQSGAGTFDVFDSWYVTIGALAKDGVIAPLDSVLKRPEVNEGDFIKAIYDPYSLYEGKRYGVPFDGDTEVLFYNREILERNGIEPPSTWDQYADAVKKITEAEKTKGVYGAALMAQKAPIIIVGTFANRLAGFGGEFLDSSGAPAMDSAAAIGAAMQMLRVKADCLPTPSETAFDQALGAFLGGKVGFMEFWTDLGVFAEDKTKSKIAGKWGVVQLPHGGTATKSLAALDAGFCLNISTAAKNQALAEDFVAFATSRETNLKLITTTGSGIDPNRVSTLNDPTYKSFAPQVQKAATASLEGALAWPTRPESPELMQSLADALAEMIASGGDPTQTMKSVQERWSTILG